MRVSKARGFAQFFLGPALALCAAAAGPALAEKVQIDPLFNAVTCPTCAGAGQTNYALEAGGNLNQIVTNTANLMKATGGSIQLVAGTAAIGSITNTAFGISGTLPAFAATPTFNIGTGGPTNYSLETGGNLATIANAQGASGTGITQPTGGSGILGWLSGIYKAVTGTLAVTVGNFPATQPVSNAGTFAVQATGNVASGTTDSGNPVKVGGVYNSTLPTLTTGQRGDLQLTSKASLYTTLFDATNGIASAVNVALPTGNANGYQGLWTNSKGLLWDGASAVQQVSIGGAVSSGVGNTAVQEAPSNAAAGGISPVVQGSSSAGLAGVCTAACNLYSLSGIAPAAGYVQVFNATTVPADGATTIGTASGNEQGCYQVLAAGSWSQTIYPPERYNVGVSVSYSSTSCATKTAAASTELKGLAK